MTQNLSRRNFLLSGASLLAGVVLGRGSSTVPVLASHPPEYERAPLPDLAGEITTDPCLTRDQIERVTEMALERACPVESSFEDSPKKAYENAIVEMLHTPDPSFSHLSKEQALVANSRK